LSFNIIAGSSFGVLTIIAGSSFGAHAFNALSSAGLTSASPFHHHHHPTALLLSSSSSFSSSSPCCLALVIIGRFCFLYTLLLSICYHRKGLLAFHLAAQHLLSLGGGFCTSMLSICYYAASFYYHQAVLSINDLFLYSSVALVLSCLLSCLVLSCPLSCLVLSCRVSCLVLSCLVLSCLVLSCLVLSCLVLSCLVLSCLVFLTSTHGLGISSTLTMPRFATDFQDNKHYWKIGFGRYITIK